MRLIYFTVALVQILFSMSSSKRSSMPEGCTGRLMLVPHWLIRPLAPLENMLPIMCSLVNVELGAQRRNTSHVCMMLLECVCHGTWAMAMWHWLRGRLATRLSQVVGTAPVSVEECRVIEEATSMVKVDWELSMSLRVQKGMKRGVDSELEEEVSYHWLTVSMAKCTSLVRWTAPVPETMDILECEKGGGVKVGCLLAQVQSLCCE